MHTYESVSAYVCKRHALTCTYPMLPVPPTCPTSCPSRSLTSELDETRNQESEFSTVAVCPDQASDPPRRENQEEIPVWSLTP
eukprot:2116065-Rhodomonas_salina.1